MVGAQGPDAGGRAMLTPPLPANEPQRLQALADAGLLDTLPEERFDRLTRLAQRCLDVPVALVSLVDENRQWFKSRQGLDACETGRDVSFCGHAIAQDDADMLVVPDATLDARFADNPLVAGPPHVVFYAGAVLRDAQGYALGTLCVIDHRPRQLDEGQRRTLRELADCVQDEIRHQLARAAQSELRQARRMAEVIARAQSQFIREADRRKAFDGLLADILALTESEYGFIGEVLHGADGEPYLKTFAITNIAWNDDTRAFYEANAPQGMEFTNLKTLFGAALKSGQPVIANDPYHDPRRGGLPEGHPALNAFLGVPVYHGGEMVAMFGISNRPGGYDQALIGFLQPLMATLGQLVGAVRLQARQQESERRLRGLFELSPLGIALNDHATGAFVDVNDALLRPTGYSREAFMALSYWDLTPREYEAQEALQLESMEKTGRYGPYEKEYIRKDGSRYPVLLNGMVVHDPSGRKMIWSIVENISERKAAERSLRESEQRFRDAAQQLRLATEAAQLGVWDLNLVSGRLEWDAGMFRIYAMAERDFGHAVEDWSRCLLPQCRDRATADFERGLAHPESSYESEFSILRADGQIRHIRAIAQALADPQGRVERMIGINEDITERKLAETALADQATHTQTILDHMVDGIITIDRHGIIQTFNPAAERIFGYGAEEAIGHNVSLLMPSPHREAHDGYLRHYQATGVARIIGIGRELEGRRKDGALFPMELAISEVTRQGQPLYVGMVRDITERRRMERMKSEFVSTVSHELRTPLTSIAGSLSLLAGGALGELPDKARQLIGIAHKNSLRLTYLINDLLDIEKIQAGRLHFDWKMQPILPLVQQAIDVNRPYGAERRIELLLTGDTRATEHVEVRVDGQRLQQVLANLLSNAIKFSPVGGKVELGLKTDLDKVRVTVTDHGPGIAPEFRSRIFQKFSQADASDTRQLGGTGLGLAISRELIERMGGRIGFDSVYGLGATFWFELPLFAESQPFGDSGWPNMNQPRVLVVEDEPDVAQVLGTLLTRAGFRVNVARTGAEALRSLQHKTFDAVSLDLRLPDISGLEVLRRIRLDPATVALPIVVVSAAMEEGRLAINGDFSDIDWLAKPVDEAQLLSSLMRHTPRDPALRTRVLHVEDDPDLHQVVQAMAGGRFEFELATSLQAARELIALERFDVVVLDIGLSDGSGWALLPDIRQRQPQARVVILSGQEMSPDQARQVESVLLKSQVSPRELIEALSQRTGGLA